MHGAAITCGIVRARSGAVQGSPLRSDHALRAWLARVHRKRICEVGLWREALTAPRPERIASGNYVMAAGMRCVLRIRVQAMANSTPSSIRRDSAYSMCSTRRW
jgi:hypothetical protein